jgi:hypothetical protein
MFRCSAQSNRLTRLRAVSDRQSRYFGSPSLYLAWDQTRPNRRVMTPTCGVSSEAGSWHVLAADRQITPLSASMAVEMRDKHKFSQPAFPAPPLHLISQSGQQISRECSQNRWTQCDTRCETALVVTADRRICLPWNCLTSEMT